MIKIDAQISETTPSPPNVRLRRNAETNRSADNAKIEISDDGEAADARDVKIRFVRLKRRIRTRSSSIF